MYSKNFILSLVSVVVFAALAAISVLVYRGDTSRSVELNESEAALKAEAVMAALAHLIDKAGGRQTVEEGKQILEQEAAPVFETLQDEWRKNARLELILLSNIKENTSKIKQSVQEVFLKE